MQIHHDETTRLRRSAYKNAKNAPNTVGNCLGSLLRSQLTFLLNKKQCHKIQQSVDMHANNLNLNLWTQCAFLIDTSKAVEQCGSTIEQLSNKKIVSIC